MGDDRLEFRESGWIMWIWDQPPTPPRSKGQAAGRNEWHVPGTTKVRAHFSREGESTARWAELWTFFKGSLKSFLKRKMPFH